MFEVSILKGESGKQSMLIMLDDIFPECKKLNKDTSLPRLSCWTNPNSCFTGSYTVCMSTLVERVYRIFDVMKDLELIILHWKSPHPGAPKDIRSWGLVIDRDENSQMKISTLNKWAVHSIETNIGQKFAIEMDL
tara:strand:+ start:159 stop:563 length:405 start_codon:yes stop_codon:yes gene_type:complete